MIPCIIGIIIKGNKVLAEKRPETETYCKGEVGLPAGHVEQKESLEKALKREMLEELGIKVLKARHFCSDPFLLQGKAFKFHYFLCLEWLGKPESIEAGKLMWLTKKQLSKLTYARQRFIARRALTKSQNKVM